MKKHDDEFIVGRWIDGKSVADEWAKEERQMKWLSFGPWILAFLWAIVIALQVIYIIKKYG